MDCCKDIPSTTVFNIELLGNDASAVLTEYYILLLEIFQEVFSNSKLLLLQVLTTYLHSFSKTSENFSIIGFILSFYRTGDSAISHKYGSIHTFNQYMWNMLILTSNYWPKSIINHIAKLLDSIMDYLLSISRSIVSPTYSHIFYKQFLSKCLSDIYFDFSKAFHHVNHSMLSKLWNLGIQGPVYKWFQKLGL